MVPCSILCHLAPVPLPVVRTPLFHSQMPVGAGIPHEMGTCSSRHLLAPGNPRFTWDPLGAGRRRPSGCQVPPPMPSSRRGGGRDCRGFPTPQSTPHCRAGALGATGDRRSGAPVMPLRDAEVKPNFTHWRRPCKAGLTETSGAQGLTAWQTWLGPGACKPTKHTFFKGKRLE